MRFATLICLLAGAATCFGQGRPDRPYGAQLKTDPDAGNLLGIQRYGRKLRTDPDQGAGFAFHVFPVARAGAGSDRGSNPGTPQAPSSRAGGKGGQIGIFRGLSADQQGEVTTILNEIREAEDDGERSIALKRLGDVLKKVPAGTDGSKQGTDESGNEDAERAKGVSKTNFQSEESSNNFSSNSGQAAGFGLTPFNATAGIRSYAPPSGPPAFSGEDALRAMSVQRPGKGVAGLTTGQIYQQPLIQIKARVVEVLRDDTLQARSVIDYISGQGDANPLFTGNNVNGNNNRTTGASRFPSESGLIGPGTSTLLGGANGVTGTGLLINATSEHINYIASLLATEFSADVITAPEVVTLNGQNVEFLAGEKLPFPIGQNVINQSSQNVQQVFYKHVGSYISVTPTIINFGKHGEGRGKAILNAADIYDWSALVREMLDERHGEIIFSEDPLSLKADLQKLPGAKRYDAAVSPTSASQIIYLDEDTALDPHAVDPETVPLSNPNVVDTGPRIHDIVVPIATRTKILEHLKSIPREVLIQHGFPIAVPDSCTGNGCNWSPEDCTIDLVVAIRLSDAFMGSITVNTGGQDVELATASSEKDVTAIANVVQVKSGHGVVMAGLIGERDVELVSKIPVLGDIPIIGAAFRSKTTNRQKSEVLIFLEARVLDPNANCARAQSQENFSLGAPFVNGEFLDNPLEYGMYRSGFGSYLPPHSHQEEIFWERLGRKIRKAATEADDIFE